MATYQRTLWEIFYCQDKINMLDGAGDMLVDFAAKGIYAEHSQKDIVEFIGTYYHQCAELCESKYQKGLEIVGKNK